MAQQLREQEIGTQWPGEEQEPIIVADRKGIVVVWPDRHTQRFSWSILRQASMVGLPPALGKEQLSKQ
ncbi:MAG: hypothetical protein HY268_18295 [Deltaproteobacteria bacterium]|nr:hypothetical protein [Deltaproteobacteria bacterium]